MYNIQLFVNLMSKIERIERPHTKVRLMLREIKKEKYFPKKHELQKLQASVSVLNVKIHDATMRKKQTEKDGFL